MHSGKTTQHVDYNRGGVKIMEVGEEKDIGVTFDQQLSFGRPLPIQVKLSQRKTRG